MLFYIETLGCARNEVDSEIMKKHLVTAGLFLTKNLSKANIIIVNTCSFIETAINDSIDTILQLSQFKKNGSCKKIIVTGCLPERFKEKIIETLPEVDFFLGTGAFDDIAYFTKHKSKDVSEKRMFPNPANRIISNSIAPDKNQYTAYLKISEGCNGKCSYCIIPKLRGKQKSRPNNQIISEAKKLIASGIKEITLIAQDTTNYGIDLSRPYKLSNLLTDLAELSKDVWIRFLYGNPETINNETIKTVALYDNICSYFDLPIQHISKNILKNMGRKYQKSHLIHLIKTIRSHIPKAAIRTTLMVGFPGETDVNFIELIDFLDKIKFDHLGVFNYSDSEDLPSHALSKHIDTDVAISRYNTIMSKQLEISSNNLYRMIGTVLKVIIESSFRNNLYRGRSMFQAPEVDGFVYVYTNQNLKFRIGDIISVKIINSLDYDLVGKPHE